MAAAHSLLDLGGIGVHTLACQPEGTLAFDGYCEIPRGLRLYPKNLAASEQEDAGVWRGAHRYRQVHYRTLWNEGGTG